MAGYYKLNDDGTFQSATRYHEGFSPLEELELKDDESYYEFYNLDGTGDLVKEEWTEYAKLNKEFHSNRETTMANMTVDYNGMTYQANEISQFRMANAITSLEPGETVSWTASDNTLVELTAIELTELKRLAGFEQAALWNRDRPSKPTSDNPF